MLRLFTYFLLLTAFALILGFLNGLRHSLYIDFVINLLASIFLLMAERLVENWQQLWLYIQTKAWYRNTTIRFSISYLYRIKVEGKYLLIKGKRVANQYQPVGGVYKRYRESFYALQGLDVTDDNNIPIDDISVDDLRVKLPGKNVSAFLTWFNTELGREVSPSREFHEELLQTGILSRKNFPYPSYIFLKRVQTSIRYSKYFNCKEILIADVFELKPNSEQLEELKRLMLSSTDEIVWVDEERIKRLGALPGSLSNFTISETANWII